MKKLKNKIYYTILFILSLSILSFIIVFNIQNYMQEKSVIENTLRMANDNKNNFFFRENERPIDDNVRFMDRIIYEVILDSSNNIIEIKNRSNNNITNNEIESIAKSILLNENLNKKYIGNLFFNKYSYSYNKGYSLIILDNSNNRENLINRLVISLMIFVVMEIVIIVVSKILTNWITKPVEESFKKQKEFVADASHELKTPLSVIIASGEALRDNPKETKWLNNIQNEADRMTKLITNLLDLAKSEKENVVLTNGNLSKVVELAVLTFEAKAFEKSLTLKSSIDDNIPFKMNDDMIKELMEILLDNAIKHSYSNETINVILKNNGKHIELLVQNKGDAIPHGEEEKIFERFYRVDKARNRSENRYGLGLAIAKNIVESHHGIITASSVNGTTTFKVLFKK